ncbi:unnamed protein product [Trifolium pratense]|uniref:Uncharacterized protein n=1 Tax=Trifolium pratense TaxID=57577 RepID=A0ACB0J7U0_TRIPR|nr:unnamed protein product [Trifolium pratense]
MLTTCPDSSKENASNTLMMNSFLKRLMHLSSSGCANGRWGHCGSATAAGRSVSAAGRPVFCCGSSGVKHLVYDYAIVNKL